MDLRLLSVLTLAAVLVTGPAPAPALDPAPVTAPAAHSPEVAAAAILRTWDERRSAAWASADPAALAALYTPRSGAGRADRSMLRDWTARGLRVEGMTMQLLAVRVRVRSADRLVLRVTDRLVGGVATGPGLRVPLPRDGPSLRTVTLRLVTGQVMGEWRVARVSGQASPVRTTS